MNRDVFAGQAVYSKKVLSFYDLWVLGFSNHFVWKCPTRLISDMFSDLATENHLDVGVGTGYYLKKNLTSSNQRVGLIDLNKNSLESTSRAIQQFKPEVYHRNVLEPLSLNCRAFDSVSINYLLHCLPGNMSEKSVIFKHLKDCMNPGATLFGSAILGTGIPKNCLAKKLMALYNNKGIFCNAQDDLEMLEKALRAQLDNVSVKVVGCVALFSGTKQNTQC